MALPKEHQAEMKKLVDEYATKGTLAKSSLQDIRNSLGFSPTGQEIQFLENYIDWRLRHAVPGVSEP